MLSAPALGFPGFDRLPIPTMTPDLIPPLPLGRRLRDRSVVRSGAIFCILLGGSTCSHGSETLVDAWKKVVGLQVNEARAEFESIRDRDGADAREASFGLALTLLNTQPKTDANLDQAASLLDDIIAGPQDDLGAWAGYFRSRVEQVHRTRPDPDLARKLFTELIERDAASAAAQFAVVKRALIDLYGGEIGKSQRVVMAELESALLTLTHDPARRDLHLLMADAAVRVFLDNEAALRHLLAADQIGIARTNTRGDVWAGIAGIARLLGQTKMARDYEERFVAEFPRDSRSATIVQRLKTDPPPGASVP